MKPFTLVALGLVVTAPASAADAVTLRARAALALAFADAGPVPRRSDYDAGYERAVREGKPLVVWVGQPARELAGCVGVSADAFPEVGGPAVVVAVPAAGGLVRRADLPGRPTDDAVRAALAPPAAVPPTPVTLRPLTRAVGGS